MVYRFLGTYYTDSGSCDVGKGISLEFALFITVFVCGLGVAAFLSLTLVVENDRKVCLRLVYVSTCEWLRNTGCGEVLTRTERQGTRQRQWWTVGGTYE